MNLPPKFFDALKLANSFTGSFAQGAPWLRHVILSGGKLHASNNHQIVEIECGVKGSAIITKKTQQLIQTITGTPTAIEVGGWLHFDWGDARYLKVKNDYDHDDVIEKIVQILDRWHGTDEVISIDLGDVHGRGIEVLDGDLLVENELAPRNGFFHSGKGTPTSRLVGGDSVLRLDDLFKIKKKELEAAKKASKRNLDRLDDEMERIEREQSETELQLKEDKRALMAFDVTIEKYRRGDELDEAEKAHLRPACEPTIKREEADERREILDKVQTELPKKIKDWDRHAESSDGEYAYITFRRRLPETETRAVIKKRIAETVDQVFEPDFPRDALLKVWESLGPIEPRAGPP